MKDGWSIWVKDGPSRYVVHVAHSDKDKAVKLAVNGHPNYIVISEVKLPADVVTFLGLEDGEVCLAVVQP